jgi:hypothetical protein
VVDVDSGGPDSAYVGRREFDGTDVVFDDLSSVADGLCAGQPVLSAPIPQRLPN